MYFEQLNARDPYNMLEKIEDTNQPLEHILEELMDGDIIVFQMDPGQDHNYELPTARDYFRDLFYKVRTLPTHTHLFQILFATIQDKPCLGGSKLL